MSKSKPAHAGERPPLATTRGNHHRHALEHGSSPPRRRLRAPTAALRIVLIYLGVSILWITLSDLAIEALFDDPAELMLASIVKGWTFVLITGLLLYVLVTRLVHLIQQSAERENELRQIRQAELETLVNERTAELQAANEELDSFAYAVSHDLRAPLRAMSGFSEALVEDHREELRPEARQWLDQIVLASTRMNELVDGLLALSRSTRGELERSVVDVSELASVALGEQARMHADRQVDVEVQAGLRVTGDPRMVQVVIDNLIDNAWKYTARTASARVRVIAGHLDDQTAVCIEDNGAGFDPRHAEHLFKPFQRLHRQDEFPGIGIGLATVARIIHRHGGDIRAAGQPGQGASFCFWLPKAG